MSNFIGELFLRLACETPLPSSGTSSQKADNIFTTKPYTRPQRKSTGKLPNPLLETFSSTKKRARKSEFDILVDSSVGDTTPAPSTKKYKPNGRVPLAIRVAFANATPSSHHSGILSSFSPSDPLWENVENYGTHPYLPTPPQTPGRPSPTPPPSPLASSRRSSRMIQSGQAPIARPLPAPKDMVLYDVLKLDSWRATEEEIKVAYKKIARDNHPDKVAEQQREDATHLMQTVNAAKEVLLDNKRRRSYHRNGKLPWST